MNDILKYISKENISKTNNLIIAASIVLAETLGDDMKKKKYNGTDKIMDPW